MIEGLIVSLMRSGNGHGSYAYLPQGTLNRTIAKNHMIENSKSKKFEIEVQLEHGDNNFEDTDGKIQICSSYSGRTK